MTEEMENDVFTDRMILVSVDAQLNRKKTHRRPVCDAVYVPCINRTREVAHGPQIQPEPIAPANSDPTAPADMGTSRKRARSPCPRDCRPRVFRNRRGERVVTVRTEAPGTPLDPLLLQLADEPVCNGGLSRYFLLELLRKVRDSAMMPHSNPAASSHAIDTLTKVPAEELKEENAQTVCAICHENMEGEVRQMPCAHSFHEDCIVNWLQICNNCPCCRCEVESCCPMYNRVKRNSIRGEVREEAMVAPEAIMKTPTPQELLVSLYAACQAHRDTARSQRQQLRKRFSF